ncbi:exonuclease [uncultured Caudovirales phage]|uniref:Exonuclease n=1 Tax=uncultured Caudovirales phage TaxID=2100421 RepID=A0A6J5NPE7_9CAUD|nr:exonuclease [uncultured Caudovirales phage]
MGRHPLKALIDGDIIIYQALGVTSVDFDGELVPDIQEATKAFDKIVCDWADRSKAESYSVCISSDTNFRKAITPTYKASRGPKPPGFQDIKDYALRTYQPIIYEGLEADDVMGILLTREPGNIAVSIDKDMKTVPGLHYNPKSGQAFQINEDEANLNWMRQVLMGDVIDGYTGIPKVGPKKAEKLLHTPAPVPVLWRVVLDAYAKAELDPKYAVATARLAYILRDGDYNNGEVQWTDPVPCEQEGLPPEYRRDVQTSRRPLAPRSGSENDERGD